MSRRANGEGSIFRRADGRYEVTAYVLTTAGTRKRVHAYGKTRTAAFEKLAELQSRHRQGIPVPAKNWRLADYCDYWLRGVVQSSRRPGTQDRSEAVVRLYLKPWLGSTRLNELSVPQVQHMLNSLLEAGHSLSLVTTVRSKLSALLTQANREELIFRNVAQLAMLPTYSAEREVEPWTASEAKRFLSAAHGDPLYLAFVLLLTYGLRLGEVTGLRWSDIDFEGNVLRVRQQIHRSRGKLRVGPLKTKASRRDLPLERSVRQLLLSTCAEQLPENLKALVVTTRTGNPVDPRNVARSLKRICAEQDLRVIHVHDLRHTTATLLKDSGVPARDAQLILGHANITTTQQIYQHGTTEGNRSAIRTLERVFWRTSGGAIRRCSQKWTSGQQMGRIFSLFISGATCRDRTGDLHVTNLGETTPDSPGFDAQSMPLPLLNSTDSPTVDRLTEIDSMVNVGRKQWLLGAVAVSVDVKYLP